MDTSIAENRSFFPRKLHLEKLYATKAEDSMVPAVAKTDIRDEFLKKVPKFTFPNPFQPFL